MASGWRYCPRLAWSSDHRPTLHRDDTSWIYSQCPWCQHDQLAFTRRRVYHPRVWHGTPGLVSACLFSRIWRAPWPCVRVRSGERFRQCYWGVGKSGCDSHTKGAWHAMGFLVSSRLQCAADIRIPVIFCGLSCGVNGLYLWYARSIMPSQYRLTSRKDQNPDLGKRRTFVLLISAIWMLPWCFWMLPMSQILQSGTVGGMQSSFNDIIRM
jgi:hypothetical protein